MRSTAAIFSVVLCACAAGLTSPEPPETAAPAADDDGGGASPPPATTMIERAAPFAVEREEGGGLLFLAGAFRGRQRGDQVEIAEQAFAQAVGSATPCDEGWIFRSVDGLVATSATFLGPLERAGEVPPSSRQMAKGRGRAAYVDRLGRLFTAACGEPAAPSSPAGGDRVIDAVFADERFGAAIVEGGRLFHTTDGGRSWLLTSSLDPHAAVRLRLLEGGLGVQTTRRAVLLDRAGVLTPLQESFLAEASPDGLTRGLDLDGVQRALHLRAPALLQRPRGGLWFSHLPAEQVSASSWAESDFFDLGDGRVVQAKGGNLRWLEGSTGRVLREVEGPGTRLCEPRPWGAGFLARGCGDERAFVSGGESWSETVLRDLFGVVASTDGRHLAWLHPCEGEPNEAGFRGRPDRGVCFLDARDGSRWSIEAPLVRPRARGLRGEWLLVMDGLGAHVIGGPDRVDHEVVLRTPERHLDARTIGWTTDGLLAGDAGRAGKVASHAFVGPPGAPIDAVPLPPDALAADFVDVRRGVAAGLDASSLYRTGDGGRTWSLVSELPLDGDPRALPLIPPWRIDVESVAEPEATVRCRQTGCVVARRLWVSLAAESVPEGPLLLGRRSPDESPSPRAIPGSETGSIGRYRCEVGGQSRVGRHLLGLRPNGPGRAHRRVEVSPGVAVAVDRWPRPGGGSRVQYTFRGFDERGPFEVRSARFDDEPPSSEHEEAPLDSLRPWIATRQGGLVETCLRGSSLCGLYWVRRGSPPLSVGRAVPAEQWMPTPQAEPELQDVVADRSGGVTLQLYVQALEGDQVVASTLAVGLGPGPGDEPRWVRPASFGFYTRGYLAFDEGRPALFLGTVDVNLPIERLRLNQLGSPRLLVLEGPLRPLRRLATEGAGSGEIRPCTAPAAPSATLLRVPGVELDGGGSRGLGGAWLALVEETDEGYCLRGVDPDIRGGSWPYRDQTLWLRSTADGRLRGFVADERGATELLCEPSTCDPDDGCYDDEEAAGEMEYEYPDTP